MIAAEFAVACQSMRQMYGSANYDKLVKLREKYDPTNLMLRQGGWNFL